MVTDRENNGSEPPVLAVDTQWEALVEPLDCEALQAILPKYVRARRWFGGKARTIAHITIEETISVPYIAGHGAILFLRVHYTDGNDDYVLPVTAAWDTTANHIRVNHSHAVIAQLAGPDGAQGVLFDAVIAPGFTQALLQAIAQQHTFQGVYGTVTASSTGAFERLGGSDQALQPRVMGVEQSNTSIVFGDQLILKLFRRRDLGINPDLEIGRFLTEQATFTHIPPVAGALEYQASDGTGGSLAILQGFVANQGDAWKYTLDQLAKYYQRVRTIEEVPESIALSTGTLLDLAAHEIPAEVYAFVGDFARSARLLARRTAEMHLALGSDAQDPQFAPEPFTVQYQEHVFASVSGLVERVFQTMRERLQYIPEGVKDEAHAVLARESQATERFRAILDHPIDAQRIRYHGDYHLGQVLSTGDDFYIIDFEGEPARPLAERRMKRSALQDVAGMLRSFHYAAYAALFEATAESSETRTILEPWARAWHRWVNTIFLRTYLQTVEDAPFIPASREELQLLLDIYLLEKAVYELGYELNNRPDWIKIPLQGVQQLLDV